MTYVDILTRYTPYNVCRTLYGYMYMWSTIVNMSEYNIIPLVVLYAHDHCLRC